MSNSLADLYSLSVEINGSKTFIGPSDFNISLKDSIHSIYPKVFLEINDTSGIFLESKIMMSGIPFKFVIGYNQKEIKMPFVVNSYEVSSTEGLQRMNGTINIELIHQLISKIPIESKAYSNTPSEIINSIVNSYKPIIKKTSIENCESVQDNAYYNPSMPFEEFVDKILLPNSKSKQNSNDPYFCFIDASNKFNYRTYSDIVSNKTGITLFLSSENNNRKENNKILSFQPFSIKLEKEISNLFFKRIYIDEENAETIKETEVSILDSYKSNYPFYDVEKRKSYEFFKIENDIGFKKDSARWNTKKILSLFPEKALVTTLLNTELISGTTINLDITYEAGHSSDTFSGEYVIEDSQHSWNKESKLGYTNLILGKVKSKLPAGSKFNKGDMLS